MQFTSEDDFLRCIDKRFPNRHGHMALGRGDDAAVLRVPEKVCLTTDLFIQDVHFRLSYFSPEDIGYKALAVNLSDAAAMGARPLGFALTLAGPSGLDAAFWDALLSGMADLALAHDVPLVGGDLSRAAQITLSVTLWAAPAASGGFLMRAAHPGDILFLCGDIGMARTGLDRLEGEGPQARDAFPACAAAHLRPVPRVREGLVLADTPGVSGLMDVSDGPAVDLPRFLGQNQGAEIVLDPNDLHPEVLAHCCAAGMDPAAFAYAGGEDYALLGAVSPDAWDTAATRLPGLKRIGRVAAAPGITLNGRQAAHSGFDHFARPAE